MYVHSVKVPRLYKDAAKVLQRVKENGGSVKKLIFESKHCNKKGLSALVNETLRRFAIIDTLIEKISLLTTETRLNPWLARILITELLWGKKQLPDKSTPLKTILTYHKKLEKLKSEVAGSLANKKTKPKVDKPRVVRVNTILTSVEDAVNTLKNEDWKLIPFTGESYDDFVSQTALLGDDEFMVDLHFKELLQFPSSAQFYKNNAYRNGLLVLQDKASCLPTYMLNPEPGSIVLDMCAAPGMKTTHLAALINNQGSVYAVERDTKRFDTLNGIVKKLSATCVKTINKDVLKVSEKDCPNVKYILVDPSCSGSGMTDRVEFEKNTKPIEERLEKLAGFQILILKHALKHFPSAQRVVYSTCSIYSKENEFVVQEVLKNELDFKLVNAHSLLKTSWKSNNIDENWKGITENCLSMKPEKDLTNGFFVAVFERTGNSHQKSQNTKAKDVNVMKKKKSVSSNDTEKQANENTTKKNKKQNKLEAKEESCDISGILEINGKKKSKKDNQTLDISKASEQVENKPTVRNEIAKSESKKKHKKQQEKLNITIDNADLATLKQNKSITGEDNNDAINETLGSLKKSKKRNKTNESLSILENLDSSSFENKKSKKHQDGIEEIVTPIESEATPKKYKRKKHDEEVNSSSIVGGDGRENESSTKKKKKRKHSGSIEDIPV